MRLCDSVLNESSVFEKKSMTTWMGLFSTLSVFVWNIVLRAFYLIEHHIYRCWMWTDGFPKNIRFTWTVQKCQRICVIMTVWFDRHHRNHLNKVPCNQKMLPDSDWCTERKGNLFFKTELPTQTSGSLAVKKNKTFQENCLLKIDVPSA